MFPLCTMYFVPRKNTFSERDRLKAEKSYEWFSYCFNRYRCTWCRLPLLRTLACKEMGESTQMPKPLLTHMRMAKIMFPPPNLPYSHISFLPSQVQVLCHRWILASVFGWVPVLLWLIIGGLFFGAVQDFGALYASVKNEGKSMGMIIEKYIGKTGRKLFMLFCWLFTLLVIAAFTDMVAGTFVGTGVEGMPDATSYANSAAASISMLFIVVAVIFGVIQKHLGSRMNEVIKAIVAIVLLVVMFIIGMKFPICTTKTAWIYIVMAYLFLASVMPMWLLMRPRDYMTTFMLLGMIIGAVVGVIVAHPSMQLNAFSGFNVGGSSLFPYFIRNDRLRCCFRFPQSGIFRNIL